MKHARRLLLPLLCLILLAAVPSIATEPFVPLAARASDHFDPKTATGAWLATIPSAARLRSDAYFEGGYWLILWDFLSLACVMLLLLETRTSARIRQVASRLARRAWLEACFYWIGFATVTAILLLPLNIYEGFLREHQYGLSNQTFISWLRDALVAFALILLLGGFAFAAIFSLVRRLPRSWPVWGAAVALVFTTLGVAIGPVFVAPLFNTYSALPDSPLRRQILSLAHANGIPVHAVYQSDASRQSSRVSANVSGLFGTDRITLNDNLLRRCSPAAVLAVMGHEMGHYVMHHVLHGVLFSAIMLLVMFRLLRTALEAVAARFGHRWGVAGVADVAILPAAVLLLAALNLLLMPVENTYIRTQEYEADLFGLNAARQPDGEAEADLLLGEYRKLDPGRLEEFVFFDHPGGRRRIDAAMRWKAENLCLFDRQLPCANPSH